MASDGVVQVPPDSTGKKVDTSELTRPDTTVVERQRISIGDPVTFANQAAVTASSALKVDGSAVTQPVSGTVTANQGGAPWSDNITQVGGSALALGQTTMASSIPVAIASNQSAVAVSQSGAPWSDNVTQFGGTNISTGTGAGGAGIPRVTVSNDSNVLATQSGTWTVQPGNTANTTPWLATINQGGNSATVTASNALKVDGSAVTQPVSGTVTANAGTNLNTSLLALESGGNLAAISGVAGTTADAAVPAGAAGTLSAKLRTIAQILAGTLSVSHAGPQPVYLDDQNTNYDDDGNLYVNPNVPGADIATGANQLAQTTVLQQIAAGAPVSQQGSWTVTSNQGGAPWSVTGTLTNNNAAPGSNNVGALTALAGSANPSYTTGDQVLLSTDLSGNLRVTGSLSVGGTTDDATFTAGTSTGTPAMGAYQATVSQLANNQLGIVALDQNRNMRVNIAAAAGTLNVSHAGIPQPVYLDDQNAVLDDQGILYVNTNVDGADISTGANQVAQTALLTQIAAGTPVSQQGAWSVNAAVSNFPSTQSVAIASNAPLAVYLDDRNVVLDDNGIPFVNINLDGADIATPLQQLAALVGPTSLAVPTSSGYIGGNASTSLPTAAPAGNLTGVMVDKFGRQVCVVSTIRDLVGTQTTTISASTSETTIVTAASGVFNDLIMLIVSNTSASTNTRIDFRDTTGGTVLFSLESNGGQPPIGFSLSTPVPQTGTNTNWTATCATSTTDIRIYAVFAKNR